MSRRDLITTDTNLKTQFKLVVRRSAGAFFPDILFLCTCCCYFYTRSFLSWSSFLFLSQSVFAHTLVIQRSSSLSLVHGFKVVEMANTEVVAIALIFMSGQLTNVLYTDHHCCC